MTLTYRVALLCALLTAPLAAQSLPLLEPTEAQSRAAIDILENLNANHYRQRNIDDQFSADLFDDYLEALDPSKSYFLQADIDQLSNWRTRLDEAIVKGKLEFGFRALNDYLRIAEQQLTANIELLKSDYAFDLSNEEYLQVDTEHRAWPTTPAERDEWWRLRMEDALLRLVMSDKTLDEAREQLAKRYKNLKNRLTEMDAEDAFQLYANAITRLYDPHTNYFSPSTMENFNINMKLSLEGIGAVLQRDEDEYIKVVRIVPGGPADKQGELKAGDRIVAIATGEDGESVDLVGWQLDDAVDLIRGPKDSLAVLQVLPASSSDTTKTVKIIRDKVKLEEQAAKSEVIEIPNGGSASRIGVIKLPTFYLDFEAARNGDPDAKSTFTDVLALLRDLNRENVDGIILDLRGNGGGSLPEATRLSDLFIDPGPVVQIRNSRNHINRHQRARRNAYYRGPLLVLIDRLSASASEIFAGAIQDYKRGIVVGSQSFGKGTVQRLLPLDEGQLKMTEAKFYRVSGDSTQNKGIIPDIHFPSRYDMSISGESNEKNALPWDQIAAAPHRQLGSLDGTIDLLNKRHLERVGGDPDFVMMTKLLELQARYREQDKQQISLKISAREQNREQRQRASLALENQRRAAKGLKPYSDFESWDKVAEELDVDTLPLSERDPRLNAAGHILVDMINLSADQQRYVNQP